MIRHIQLLYFAEIVDRGSFSAASKSLYVSQSALSQSLAGLEEELGVKLIRRSKSGVSLTYFGHRVYEDAKVLISSLQNFESGWRSLITEGSDLKGEVYIQCTPGAESYLSKNIVSDLRESYPNIELHISPSGQMRFGFQSFINA